MYQYKVSYYTIASYEEDYVEANSEFEAISKVQRGRRVMSKIKVKKVFKPTADDYYRMREMFYISTSLLMATLVVILIRALVK